MNGLKKEEAEYFGLGDQPAIQVGGVVPSTPAEKAGLLLGDLLLTLDGQSMTDTDSVQEVLRKSKPGDRIEAGLVRGGALVKVTIQLTTRPKG